MSDNQYNLSVKISGDVGDFNSAMDTVDKKVSSVNSNLGNVGKVLQTVGGGFESVGKALMPVTTLVTAAGVASAKTAIDFLSLKQQAETAFTTLMGSAESAQTMIDDLYTFAKTTPFKYDQYLTAAQNMMAMGVAAEDVIPYLQAITDAAVGSGKGADGVDQLTNAFSRMTAKGKISMEELNMVSEAGIPAVKILANEYGVTTSQMMDMVSSGSMLSDEVLPKLVDGMNNGTNGAAGMTAAYSGLANEYKKTLPGAIDTLTSRFRNMSIEMFNAEDAFPELVSIIRTFTDTLNFLPGVFSAISSASVPVLTAINDKLKQFNDFMANASPETLEAIGKAIIGLAAAGPAFLIIGKGVSSVGLLVEKFHGLQGAIGKIVSAGGPLGNILSTLGKYAGPIAAIVAVFAIAYAKSEAFRDSINGLVKTIGSGLMGVVNAIMPILQTIWTVVSGLIEQLATALAPAISTISTLLSTVFSALMPFLQAITPALQTIISTVGQVIGTIITIVTPIISFVAGVIAKIVQKISPIVQFILSVVSSIINVVAKIIGPISTTFGKVKSIVVGVFNAIKGAWSGLTGIVGAVASGVSSAFQSLVSHLKGIINVFISGINGAISIINKIPGVKINKIKKLARGTENWQGGFAVMNEGGRGELVNLPNGSQVIPHDLSVQYAKESAKANAQPTVIVDNSGSAGGEYSFEIPFIMDGQQFAKATAKFTQAELDKLQTRANRQRGYV